MRKQQPWLEQHGVTGKHEDVVIRRENAVDIVRRQLTDAKGKPKFNDPNDRRVIYASPLVDVAGNMDLVHETVEICKVICELTHWQIRLLSKSNLLPKIAETMDAWSHGRTYYDARDWPHKRIIYGVSTGTLSNGLARAFEQGTPLVSKRIESIRWLQDKGYRTFGMVCPSLPMKDSLDYRLFAQDMSDWLRYDRMEHVWAEVINTRGESFTRTHAALLDAGFKDEAARLKVVSEDKEKWEQYARDTFYAHTTYCKPDKLRFLQYVNNDNSDYWEANVGKGAVLL
jgi:hypothetical protein